MSNSPAKFVAIPENGRTRTDLTKTILNNLGLPNSEDLAPLLGAISNVDL
jgi:hypothetical protein